ERVIAAFNRVDLRRWTKVLHKRLNLLRRPERIARALHKQHRLLDVLEVFDAQLCGIARRMQRVTEKHETADIKRERLCVTRRDDLRRDAPAHRLSTDYQAVRLQLAVLRNRFDHGAKTFLELRFLIGNGTSL